MFSMPDELIDSVVQNLAYPMESFHHEVDLNYKLPSSPSLFSLSQVNQQLRRVCLPLLFTYVWIGCSDDAEKVMKGSAKSLFARFTKTLVLGSRERKSLSGPVLQDLLDFLQKLSCIDLRCDMDHTSFDTIHQHYTISTIYVDSQNKLPEPFVDLSKVILRRFELQSYDDFGSIGLHHQTMSHLYIKNYYLSEAELGTSTFSSLHELTLMQHIPCGLSWLPTFASAHPHLKIIRFIPEPYIHGIGMAIRENYFENHKLPFFPPFLRFAEDLRQHNFSRSFHLVHIALTRANHANNANTFTRQWCVTTLKIYVTLDFPWIEALNIISIAFPKINTLAIDFDPVQCANCCDINELINALERLLALQKLDLECSYDRHYAGAGKPWQTILQASQHEKLLPSTVVEAGMFWYTSLIAQRIPSLHTICVRDLDGSGSLSLYSRHLIVQSPRGGREVIGDWNLSYDHQILLSLALKRERWTQEELPEEMFQLGLRKHQARSSCCMNQ